MKRSHSILGFLASILLGSSAFATTLDIKSINVNGSACPLGTATVTKVDSDFDGRDDFFQVTYSRFAVERPGEPAVKNCNIELLMGIPRGYQFSVASVANIGYADIHELHEGRLDVEYAFPFVGRWTATTTFSGRYTNDFETLTEFPAASWSRCNMNVPLNLNVRASIRRKPTVFSDTGAYSIVSVERTSGLFIQYFFVRWRPC